MKKIKKQIEKEIKKIEEKMFSHIEKGEISAANVCSGQIKGLFQALEMIELARQ